MLTAKQVKAMFAALDSSATIKRFNEAVQRDPRTLQQQGYELMQRPEMLDIGSADTCEIKIDATARRIWINVNGVCRLRVQRISVLEIDNAADPVGSGQVHPYTDQEPTHER
jgi:hypothetical protein